MRTREPAWSGLVGCRRRRAARLPMDLSPTPVRSLLGHEVPAPAMRQPSGLTAGPPSSANGPLVFATTLHYDSRRKVHYAKPLLRGWLHLLWFEASLVAGTLLWVATSGGRQSIGVGIYAGCLSGLFGVSALYHRGNWGPVASRILQRADHVMILLSIAGTATPVFLLAVPGTYGLVCLTLLWSLIAVA